MQKPCLFRHAEIAVPARALEKRSAVYTKPWIIELILDMAGYDPGSDLTAKFAVEAIVEMQEADTFASEVSAYPVVTVIRKGSQHSAVVASQRRLRRAGQRTAGGGEGRRRHQGTRHRRSTYGGRSKPSSSTS